MYIHKPEDRLQLPFDPKVVYQAFNQCKISKVSSDSTILDSNNKLIINVINKNFYPTVTPH
jgi:hypothetical protein